MSIVKIFSLYLQLNIPESESYDIRSFSRLGLHTPTDTEIPIPVVFQVGANVIISNHNGSFNALSTHQFDDLQFPLEFKLSFCGEFGK